MWQCEDPRFSLAYSRDEKGFLVQHEELEWNNETMLVDVCFVHGVRKYEVYLDSPSPYVRHEDRLFSGTWKYRRGDLVLIIEDDFLFDNRYSELVFSPVSQNQ